MTQLKNLIAELLKIETDLYSVIKTGLDSRFITVYLSSSTGNKKELKTEAKSLLIGAFSKAHHDANKEFQTLIIESILTKIESLESLTKGVAFYYVIKSDSIADAVYNESDLRYIQLVDHVDNSATIGSAYVLSQLIYCSQKITNTLVMHIQSAEAEVYLLNDQELKKITRFDSNYASDDEHDGNPELVRGSADNAKYPATSTEMEFYRLFLHDINLGLSTLLGDHKYDAVVIFASTKFRGYVEYLNTNFKHYASHKILIEISDGINAHNLETSSQEILKKDEKVELEEHLTKLKNNYNHYLTKLPDIALAAKEGRINNLYLKLSLTQRGKITDVIRITGLVESELDTIPWLINQVIKTAGKVSILPTEYDFAPLISAELRY